VGSHSLETEIPAKEKLFMWLLLTNKSPTWENLQKISFVGLAIVHSANRIQRISPTYFYIVPSQKQSGKT
jgi:hypothetical protein